MRIVFVAWRDLANDLAGGSEILVDRLASGLTARGHDVALMCAEPIAPRAYEVVANGSRHTQYLRAPFTYLNRFTDADLVVDVANGMAFYASVWRRGASVCFVNHVHTDQWDQWFPKPIAAFGRTMEQHGMPLAYRKRLFAAVSPSTSVALQELGVREEQIRIVCNGVDLPTTVAPKSPEPLFLAVGRLVPHKRFDLLVRAWEVVRPHTGGRLVLVGEGPERTRAAIEAAAGEGVEMIGRVSDEEKERLYGEAWVLVHPAMHEGWGLVIMEAAAHGTPTLGFRVPGVRDSVVHDRSGRLVETEMELVAQWVDLATDHEARARLGAGARRRAAEFSWQSTVDRFESIAIEAVTAWGPPRAGRPRRVPAPIDLTVRPHEPSVSASPSRRRLAQPALSIVVPAFNEASRLPLSLPQLLEQLRGTGAEIIVVDDGSIDGTGQVATRLLREAPRAQVVALPRHLGKGAAVRAGVSRAEGAVISFMDADLATDIGDLPRLLAALDGAHVAIGSRTSPGSVVTGMTATRAALERTFNAVARSVTGLELRDTQCGFKAFRGPVAKLLFHLSREDGFAFDVEILALAARIGYRMAEVPVHWHAVQGSHIRVPGDMLSLSASALRIGTRTRPLRVMASLRAWCRAGEREAAEIAVGLRTHLPDSAPVVVREREALALLPFVEPWASHAIATSLQERLSGVVVQPSVLAGAELFDPAAHELRAALATA